MANRVVFLVPLLVVCLFSQVFGLAFDKEANTEDTNAKDITFTKINGKISSDSFAKWISLKSVNIFNSTITEIEDGALCINGVIEKLEIRFSQLPKITQKMFGDKCSSLKTLVLNGNPTSFDDDSFQSLPELKDLDLHLQEVTSLNKNLLKLKNLHSLAIKESTINKIEPDAFDNLPNLKWLNLRDMKNKIQIPQRLLKDLDKVEFLNLDGSDLSHLNWVDVGALNKLQILQIAGCNIDEFDVDWIKKLFPALKTIDISNNMMTCAELQKVARDLKARYDLITVHVLSSAKENRACD